MHTYPKLPLISPEKLVEEYVEQMRKEKMKEENRRERMERLNREYNGIDWVGLYNSDKLSSLRVNKLSLPFPSQDHLQRKESGKCCNNQNVHWQLAVQFQSMERRQPRKPPLRNMQ